MRDDTRQRHIRRYHCDSPKLEELSPGGGVPSKRSLSHVELENEDHKRYRLRVNGSFGQSNLNFDPSPVSGGSEFSAQHALGTTERSPGDAAYQSSNVYSMPLATNEPATSSPQEWQLELEQTMVSIMNDSFYVLPSLESEFPSALPELSRGNTTESAESALEDSQVSESAPNTAKQDTPSLGAFLSQEPDRAAGKRAKTRLPKFGTTCTICKKPYETDDAELRNHLYRHLDEQQQQHLCATCDVGFVHKADFDHHIRCAKQGSCGFTFRHANPCTGHHPPTRLSGGVQFTDHDRFKLGSLLREWELSQLQLHEASIQRQIEQRSWTKRLSRSSIVDKVLTRKGSLSSLVYSLNSFRSEPQGAYWNDMVGLQDLEKKLGGLSLGETSQYINDTSQKIKELLANNDALRKAAACGDTYSVISALGKGANVDARGRAVGSTADFKDLTPLLLAAQNGHVDVVKCLLAHGAGANDSDSKGETALHKAATIGASEIVHELLRQHADCTLLDDHGSSPLLKSVILDKANVTQLLLQSQTLESLPRGEGTILFHLAVKHNAPASLQVLLDFGIDPNCRLSEHFLLTCNSSMATVDMLVDEDMCPHRPLNDATPLYTASEHGYVVIVLMLLTAGARVNAKGQWGTPIGAAVANKHVETASALFLFGADPFDASCWKGRSAYDIAYQSGALDIVQAFWNFRERENMVRFLQTYNAKLGGVPAGVSPLHIASGRGDLDIVKLLLSADANPNSSRHVPHSHHGGGSALGEAIASNNADVVDTLLDHKADPFRPNCWNGRDAFEAAAYLRANSILERLFERYAGLHDLRKHVVEVIILAAQLGEIDSLNLALQYGLANGLAFSVDDSISAKSLLEHGTIDCDPFVTVGSPLYLASANGHTRIVQTILAHGVDPNAPKMSAQWNPLHAATRACSIDIMTLLLDAGAQVDAEDANGFTSLELALGLGDTIRRTRKPNPHVVDMLLCRGAYANRRGPNGDGILVRVLGHLWCEASELWEIMALLITHGADVDDRNTYCGKSITPLYFAASQDRPTAVQGLLDRGAAVNALVHGETAFSQADQKGFAETKAVLAARGGIAGPGDAINDCNCLVQRL